MFFNAIAFVCPLYIWISNWAETPSSLGQTQEKGKRESFEANEDSENSLLDLLLSLTLNIRVHEHQIPGR